jgi:hypothetical protein
VALNQVSLFFYPPRWRQQLTELPGTYGTDGKPARLAEVVRDPETAGPIASFAAIVGWLEEQGFTPVEWENRRCFHKGQVRSMFGPDTRVR